MVSDDLIGSSKEAEGPLQIEGPNFQELEIPESLQEEAAFRSSIHNSRNQSRKLRAGNEQSCEQNSEFNYSNPYIDATEMTRQDEQPSMIGDNSMVQFHTFENSQADQQDGFGGQDLQQEGGPGGINVRKMSVTLEREK